MSNNLGSHMSVTVFAYVCVCVCVGGWVGGWRGGLIEARKDYRVGIHYNVLDGLLRRLERGRIKNFSLPGIPR